MKLTVKVVNGQQCTVAASPRIAVMDVKEQVNALMAIPVAEQTLLYKGKALLDEKLLQDYNIEDGGKLNLVVKKSATISKKGVSKDSALMKTAAQERPVWVKMLSFLRRHFCEKDAQAVLAEFKKEFEQNLSSLSLDDIERLAISKLRQA